MTEQQHPADATLVPPCPKCGGAMWDNRVGKRNPKAPDFKCKDRSCDGVIWPPRGARPAAGTPAPASAPADARPGGVFPDGMPACPICGGPMWDDRASKRNPRAPDFKCRNKPRERGGPGCEGVIWPARDGSPSPYPPPIARRSAPSTSARPFADAPPFDDAPPHDDSDIPF